MADCSTLFWNKPPIKCNRESVLSPRIRKKCNIQLILSIRLSVCNPYEPIHYFYIFDATV